MDLWVASSNWCTCIGQSELTEWRAWPHGVGIESVESGSSFFSQQHKESSGKHVEWKKQKIRNQIANETYQLSNHDNCHYSIPFNNKIGENRKPFVWERQKPFHYCCYSNNSSIRSISNIDSSDVHKVGRILESLLPIPISIHFRYSPPSIRTLSMDLGYCGWGVIKGRELDRHVDWVMGNRVLPQR